MNRHEWSVGVVLALGLSLSLGGCKNKGETSDAPEELELAPANEVADTTPKPKSEATPKAVDPVEDEKVTAQKVEPPAPNPTTPQDRDPKAEEAKMKRSRQKSGKARQLLRSGQDDKAIAEARNALRDHEQNVEAMLVIAEAFYRQGKHELVQSVTGSILKVDPKVLDPREKSQAYNLMGFAYLQAGSRYEAFKAFKNAAETDDQNASAWNNLGVQYMWRADTATAESCFEYAVSLDPKFAEAQLNWGAALRSNNKLPEAESAYRAASKLRPDWAEVHFNLGVLYLDADKLPNHDEIAKLDAAIKEFETYKSLVAKGKTSIERSTKQKGPTDAMGNELVSVAQADLYIKAANKGIASEERRIERDEKRKKKQADAAAEEAEAAKAAEQAEAENKEGEGEGEDESEPPAQQPAPDKPAEKPPAQKPPPSEEPPAQKPPAPSEKPQSPSKPQSPTQKPQQPQKPKPQKPGG